MTGVCVGAVVGVRVGDGVAVTVAVGVADGVTEGEGVDVGVAVTVAVGVDVSVGYGVQVGIGSAVAVGSDHGPPGVRPARNVADPTSEVATSNATAINSRDMATAHGAVCPWCWRLLLSESRRNLSAYYPLPP
jgi:hypothetical protein